MLGYDSRLDQQCNAFGMLYGSKTDLWPRRELLSWNGPAAYNSCVLLGGAKFVVELPLSRPWATHVERATSPPSTSHHHQEFGESWVGIRDDPPNPRDPR